MNNKKEQKIRGTILYGWHRKSTRYWWLCLAAFILESGGRHPLS